MKSTSIAFGIIILSSFVYSANADAELIAYWNFNSFDGTGTQISATQGTGTINLSSWNGGIDDADGTTMNALNSDPKGKALQLLQENGSGNDSFIQIEFSMTGQQNLNLSFATRGSSKGFNNGQWAFSTDGTNFTNFGNNTAKRVGWGQPASLNTNGLDNAASAFLRYTLSGAEKNGESNRIDNLQLNASAIPEPTSLVLFGAALVTFWPRRRK